MTSEIKQHPRKKIWSKILLILLILIVLALIGGRLWFRLPVLDYYRSSSAVLKFPGLIDGFVPQGLAYLKDSDQLLITGYMANHSASPLYLLNRADGKIIKQVTLTQADGNLSTNHNGGLTEHDGLIYICDDTTNALQVFSLAELLAASERDTIHEIGSVSLSKNDDMIIPAFVEATENGLVVGEFYYPVRYETSAKHIAGTNHALAVLFPYDDSALGVCDVPAAAYSMPDKTQGICFDEQGKMWVSESMGLSFSKIKIYDVSTVSDEMNVLGVQVPLTMLNESNLISSAKIAPMSEEIAIIDQKLYIGNESASRKYLFGILNGAWNMYATDVSFFRNKTSNQ